MRHSRIQFRSFGNMRIAFLACLILGLFTGATQPSGAAEKKSFTFGMIAKSQGNQFFEAARSGANAASRELGSKYGITIKIDWRTPNEEDAQKQAEYIEQMVLAGVDGIIISSSDANKLNDAIDRADARGVPVLTFSGDAPGSKRFLAIGVDDFKCGEQTFLELGGLLK